MLKNLGFLSTLAVAQLLVTGTFAKPAPQVYVPPLGLYCCPPNGPGGLSLVTQQTGPFSIFCYYTTGTETACFYNPGTGGGGGPSAGCPTQAPANPHPPTCPV